MEYLFILVMSVLGLLWLYSIIRFVKWAWHRGEKEEKGRD